MDRMNMWFCCLEYEMITDKIGVRKAPLNVKRTICANRQRIVRMTGMLFVFVDLIANAPNAQKQVAERIIRPSSIAITQTRELISSTLWFCVQNNHRVCVLVRFFSLASKKHPPFLVFWLQNPFTFQDSLWFFVQQIREIKL